MSLSTVAPLTPEQASRLMRKLISSYPMANPMMLKEYLSEVAVVLASYSENVATAGVERAMAASPNFPPSVPLIKNQCDELIVSGASYARQWEMQSQKQLLERAEREAQTDPLDYRRAVTARILGEYHARCAPEAAPQRATWRQFSDDDLRAIYPRIDPTSGGV
jgi:hypothetical protein